MATVSLVGAKPGIDGTYLIFSAEHLYSRQGLHSPTSKSSLSSLESKIGRTFAFRLAGVLRILARRSVCPGKPRR